MEEIRLDWSAAEVKDGSLSVPLSDKVPSDWKDHFETTVKLLGHGEWSKVRLKKGSVRVEDLSPGEEDRLRFYLDGVVDQANAAVRSAEEAEQESAADEDGEDEAEATGPDAEMTERFRSFAQEEPEESAEQERQAAS